jgi:hypothetical protein
MRNAEFKRPLDFGPSLSAPKAKRAQAVKRWTAWWAKREAKPPQTAEQQSEAEPRRMAAALVAADRERQRKLLIEYRDTKGVQYTEAMAYAIARLKGGVRNEVRDALVQRLTRMTVGTLGPYLGDEGAEIRRAAVLALADKRVTAHLGKMIGLLNDPEPAVATAALVALRALSGQDFGPRLGASESEKAEALRQWRRWAERVLSVSVQNLVMPRSAWRSSRAGAGGLPGRDTGGRPRQGGHRLFQIPLQFRNERLEVFPLTQGIKRGVFLHVRHVLVALAHRIAQEPHRRVAGPGRPALRWSSA